MRTLQWHNLESYLIDLVEQAHLYQEAAHPEGHEYPKSADTPQELSRHAQDTIDLLASQYVIQGAGAPLLSHLDLHTRNILVDPDDPTKITGVIDWESAAVEPAFMLAAETPVFAAELPDDHASRQLFDHEEGRNWAHARSRADVDFCVKSWSLVPMIYEKL